MRTAKEPRARIKQINYIIRYWRSFYPDPADPSDFNGEMNNRRQRMIDLKDERNELRNQLLTTNY